MTTGVRVRVEGLERLEPGTTYMFVSNHQSIYDIPVIFWWLPYQLRIIAKESLGSFPFLGWHLRRSGHLLVDRRNPDRAGILRRWRDLVVERPVAHHLPGRHAQRRRPGGALQGRARSCSPSRPGLPVVPLSIVGTRFVMRKGRLTVAPGTRDAGRPPADRHRGARRAADD